MKAPEQISPDFAVVASADDVRSFASSHAFPLILKPANLAKSLLVTKNDSIEELLENYDTSIRMLESTYAKYVSNRSPKLIIEEYLEGSIHSVDAFVNSSGTPLVLDQIVDYQTGYDVGYNDNFHYSRSLPTGLSSEQQAALRHCARVGIEALGMKNSAAHVEIILTANGPRIVEIGARNGGYRERMHRLANGIDITGAFLKTALGQPVSIESTCSDGCAVIELFPQTRGVFKSIRNIEQLRRLPSFHSLSIKAKSDEDVGLSRDGYRACAFVIIHHSDLTVFDQDFDYIKENVFVEVK